MKTLKLKNLPYTLLMIGILYLTVVLMTECFNPFDWIKGVKIGFLISFFMFIFIYEFYLAIEETH